MIHKIRVIYINYVHFTYKESITCSFNVNIKLYTFTQIKKNFTFPDVAEAINRVHVKHTC